MIWRWRIRAFTFADYARIDAIGEWSPRAAFSPLVEAGLLTRIIFRRAIYSDLERQGLRCGFPQGGVSPPSGEKDNSRENGSRMAAMIFSHYGISPQDQYEKLSPREWRHLCAHAGYEKKVGMMTRAAIAGALKKNTPDPIYPHPDFVESEIASMSHGDAMGASERLFSMLNPVPKPEMVN